MNPIPLEYLPVAAATTVRSATCTAHVWRPVKGVVVSRVEGCFSSEAATLIEAKVRNCVAMDGSILGIHDWWEATDYVTSARTRLTGLAVDLRKHTEGIHVLVQSRLLVLAVQTANLAVRNITAYGDRSPFERYLQSIIRTRPAVLR